MDADSLYSGAESATSCQYRSMERMALKLFAVWTELQSLMKDYTLMALEGDQAIAYAEREKYADDFILDEYKKVVRNVYGVAFPHLFSQIYKRAKQVRDKLAHMIDIDSIEGSQPHRVLKIVRSNGFESYQEGTWIQQRYIEDIREEDLAYAIRATKEALSWVHIIYNLGARFKELDPADDEVWDFHWVPWWDGRWGPPPTHPTQGYRAPVGRYRHHPEPRGERAYWVDKRNWHNFTNEADE
ncbi:hypothetical protein D2E44_25145 [Mycobacteroides abscessus]|nr:hypothetical protein DDJ37_17250 [Mycobacteroides abscessus]RIS77771.1 hypothetical protein D2E44_25145 [Mycobacteroides abscessus]